MAFKPSKVLVIGSGPIVIAQAAEFDYAGAQACRSLREEGVITVLVNPNPATIMTDEDIADIVYIEPLTVEVLERIIARERPDGLLPTLGGQTGLNMAVELAEKGILDKYGVRLLGTPLMAIKRAEDRELFRQLLQEIGEPQPPNTTVTSVAEARRFAEEVGLPLVVRPAYTLGGTGGGMVRRWEELEEIVQRGLHASPVHQVLLERSVEGWKELEYEVMRDGANNCITVCNMENMDPMGVHTGESIVVAPSQTLSDKEHQMLRSAALRIIRALGIEGGCNIQFALAPHPIVAEALPEAARPKSPLDYYVIEVNPRVSRSSALASKATGYPIARVAAKIAIGKRLDEIPNAVTRKTLACFEPALDYCVVKIPRWPFDKFPYADRTLTTQMKSTGEVMAIDRTFEAALQKAVRGLEHQAKNLLWEAPAWRERKDWRDIPLFPPHDLRLWAIAAAIRRGATPEEVSRTSLIDPWFTRAIGRIMQMEQRLLKEELTPALLREAKRMGFSDATIAALGHAQGLPERVRALRQQWGIRPVYKMVDTCAAEFEAVTPYFYSTYEQENEAPPLPGRKALVIGSGPIRIGQGIEFDYCSVHAAWALQKAGWKALMANSNPETVSTDFDTSDRLYFEALDEEAVRDLLENEAAEEGPPPTVVQFGGQTALNLSQGVDRAGLPILGSSAKAIDIASDRSKWEEFLSSLGIPQPPGAAVLSVQDALEVAEHIGYPVLVRPSYVLGGRAMEIVYTPEELEQYARSALEVSPGKPLLVDKYMEGKECEVDAVCDGEEVLIPGMMEHIERAGVHSGDAITVYPGVTLTPEEVETLVDYTQRIGRALGVVGLMNVQFIVMGGPPYRTPRQPPSEPFKSTVYVIEANPRASRTIPFISKVTGVPMVRLATHAMLGISLRRQGWQGGLYRRMKLVAVKAPVFSMSKLTGADTYLGPEMKSTGEVMGIDHDFHAALTKALMAAGMHLPPKGNILLSLSDRTKPEGAEIALALARQGWGFYATEGTARFLRDVGISHVKTVSKLTHSTPDQPSVVDVIKAGLVDAVVNTLSGGRDPLRDGFYIRRAAAERRIPCFTWLDTARAAVEALISNGGRYTVRRLPEYREGPPPTPAG
ncbi:MAG: carbamoyl-phosphate synthase large subunit [Dehalococcoidia bacterium]|nr:carbamoyl-phosphate synthase large subunit [Dehalococcoidia bacterium]MDW8120391.1 carbamoyl-phosphate synthase large subunit [Chloroflexota bacterium]